MSARPPAMANPITASTMIIRTQRGRWRVLLDSLLTLIAWVVFVYLFAAGIWSVVMHSHPGAVDLPWLSRLLPTVSNLGVYLLAMLIQGGLLLLWARYNWWRFHGQDRRARIAPLDDESLLRWSGIPAQALQRLRQAPVSVIHHAPDGSIYRVSSQDLQPFSSLPDGAAQPAGFY